MKNGYGVLISVGVSLALCILGLGVRETIALHEVVRMILTAFASVYALLPFIAVLAMLAMLHNKDMVPKLPPFNNLNLVTAFCNTGLYILAGLPLLALIYGGSYVAYAYLYEKLQSTT
jgi:hypothetical protein